EALRLALQPWSGHAAAVPPPQGPEPPQAAAVVDRQALALLVGGDLALADSLLADFPRINAPLVEDLPRLAAAADAEARAAAAHRLPGSARTAQAPALARALGALEQAARSNSMIEARALCGAVAEEFAQVREAVETLSA